MDFTSGTASTKLNEMLPESADYSGQELLEYLIREPEEPLVQIEDDTLVSVHETAFRHHFELSEPYEPPEDAAKNEVALDFAQWLKREEELLPVRMDLDHTPRKAHVYQFDSEERIWQNRGNFAATVVDKIGSELPKRNGNGFKKRVRNSLFGQWNDSFENMGLEEQKLAVQDGLLDFKTNQVRDIEREDRVLNKLPVSFHETPDEYPDLWIDWLEDMTRNQAARDTLQEFVGYTLMHWTRKHRKMLLLLGPTRTGKSTFLNVVETLLGEDNVSEQPLEDLCSDGPAGRWSPKHLKGKIANIHRDLDGDAIDSTQVLKNLTEPGESINAEIKGVSQFELEPDAKHLYAANSAPSIDKQEAAPYDRFLTVRFENQIPRGERDENLEDKLTEPEVLNGIFKWALDGMRRLEEQGSFTMNLSEIATQELWEMYGSGPKRFVHQTCDLKYRASSSTDTSDWYEPTTKLHEHYKQWAQNHDTYEVCGIQKFVIQVKEVTGVTKTKRPIGPDGNDKRVFKGLKVKDGVNLERLQDLGGEGQ